MIKDGIHLIDCKKGMRKIRAGTVDLICTDPPYIKDEWEAAYKNLAEGAGRILKPGGYLITYCGHYYLPGVLDILRTENLTFYWIVAQLNSGSKSLMHHRNIIAGYKPILIFQKNPVNPSNKIFMDVISGRQSKDHHPWEQSIHEALHLLTRFGSPGDLMVDPFLGSGTWCLAAQLIGIRHIGFEINPDTYRTAQERLTQRPLDLSSFGPCDTCRDCGSLDRCGSRDPHAGCEREAVTGGGTA